jgi:hypothetical protein
MSTDWKIVAIIHDEERRELWSEVFPDAVVPILSIIPQWVRVPEWGETRAYMLDLVALTSAQLDGVIAIIAKRFGLPLDEVRAEIWQGVPIVADGVSVGTCDQGMFFSMMDDFDRQDDDEEVEL